MKHLNGLHHATIALCAALLAGCGGGGGGGGGTTPSATALALASGEDYAWLLKAQGPTNARTYGISLIHPSTPTVEYEIEPVGSAITDITVISSGNVDVATSRAHDIKPRYLLYIVGGDVHMISLRPNGAVPAKLRQTHGVNNACKFTLHANDFATPDRSRYIFSTMGADGQCGTGDDGQGEVILGASGTLSFSTWSDGNQIQGMVRDATTLAPFAWIEKYGVRRMDPPTLHALRINNDPVLTRVVVADVSSAIAECNNRLTVWHVDSSKWPSVTETRLDDALTLGSGWQAIGFDMDNFYVYRNAGTTTSPTWSILRITRAAPTATRLASGPGQIKTATMGTNKLYASILGASSNSLIALDKYDPAGHATLETSASSVATMVLTSRNGIHLLWRVSNPDSASPRYVIEMIDEHGNILSSDDAAYLMLPQAASVLDFNTSENKSRFLFATGFTKAKGYADASLVAYDTATQTRTTLGTLPGPSDFGSDPVFVGLINTTTNQMLGYTARIVAGELQARDSKYISFDVTRQGSLR